MLSAFWHLSSLQTAQLALRAAEKTCQQLEQAAHMPSLQRFPTSGYVALLLGEIHMERNDLAAAERYLLESAEQINPESFPLALLRGPMLLCRASKPFTEIPKRQRTIGSLLSNWNA